MISLFSFILVLGIVVDDAIVVGENIYSKQKETRSGLEGAVQGVQEVMIPVIFGVTDHGGCFRPDAVCARHQRQDLAGHSVHRHSDADVLADRVAADSAEPPVAPPAAGEAPPNERAACAPGTAFSTSSSVGLEWFIDNIYRRVLEVAVEWRYATVARGLDDPRC